MRRYLAETFLAIGLVLLAALAFWPLCTERYEFLNLDDQKYVTDNPHVRTGLSRANAEWALGTFHASLWHPLTWWSLQLDAQLYGVDARGFHLTNLLLHGANTVLLFLVLWRLTGARWRSAVVAAFFALHPLHVESVAWITERKDVLSTFFWILTLGVYTFYAPVGPACRAGPEKRSRPAGGTYALLLVVFALGLMAKAMLVTLPFALLLLDYWPLGRWTSVRATGRLLVEKVPLFVLALAASSVALIAGQTQVQPADQLPLGPRVGNALVSYVVYLRQTVWPSDLAVFYPHPAAAYLRNTAWYLSETSVILTAGLLLAITGLVLWGARRAPYLAVGWFWYLGTLVPVLGLVQNGLPGHADRYTYVPLIGIFLMLAWGISDLAKRWSVPLVALGSAVAALVAVCLGLTIGQVRYWRNTVTLWEHAVAVTPPNPLAEQSLGLELARLGRTAEAERHLEAAVRLDPADAQTYIHLGDLLLSAGRLKEAEANYRAAQQANPAWAAPPTCLGNLLLRKGHLGPAAEQFEEALQRDPGSANRPIILVGLGECRLKQGRPQEAVRHLRAAVASDPYLWQAHYYLGCALFWQLGTHDAGLEQFREAVRLRPDNARCHADLAAALWETGQTAAAEAAFRRADQLDPEWQPQVRRAAWTYATAADADRRRGAEAVHLARVACHARHDERAGELDTLAAAYAEVGCFDAAVRTARKAIDCAVSAGDGSHASEIRARLQLYESRKPFRQ
jgi:tetratricopeptide (TPR) repeat protein